MSIRLPKGETGFCRVGGLDLGACVSELLEHWDFTLGIRLKWPGLFESFVFLSFWDFELEGKIRLLKEVIVFQMTGSKKFLF